MILFNIKNALMERKISLLIQRELGRVGTNNNRYVIYTPKQIH